MSALELKLIGIALVVVALLGAYGWWHHHVSAQQHAADVAAQAEQHDRDVATARAKEAQIAAAQGAASHEATNFRLASQLDARDAVDADRRLQQRFAAINARCLPGDPATAAGSAPADDAARMRADVLGRVVAAARLAASAADAAHGPGLNAERQYDALKTP